MSSALIKNAAPQMIALGANDLSGRTLAVEEQPTPQHLPLFYIWAKKGSTNRELVDSSTMLELYGDESFDINEQWFNHQTRFLNAVTAEGNTCMVQRLVPSDAGANSNATIFIDLLETKVPNYKRDSYGSYMVDSDTGEYLVDEENPTIDGYKIKLIREYYDEDLESGAVNVKNGTMSEVVTTYVEIADAYKGLFSNFTTAFKVGDTIPLADLITATDGMSVDVALSNTSVVSKVDNNGTIEYHAVGAGSCGVTLTLSATDSESEDALQTSTIEFSVSVQEDDLLAEQNITVDGIVQTLTSSEPSMTLTISGDNAANCTVTVNNSSIASVEYTSQTDNSQTVTITGLTNGITYVTVCAGTTATQESCITVFTLQSKVVDEVESTSTNVSRMYPILQLKAKNPGEWYNNVGFAISSLSSSEVDETILEETKSMCYKLALYERDDANSSPDVKQSLYGETSVLFSFKEKCINPNTEARMDFEKVYDSNWFNETDSLLNLKYYDYEYFYFYRDNFETVSKLVMEKEKAYVSDEEQTWADGYDNTTYSWYDFTTTDQDELSDEYLLINLFSQQTTQGVNYFTLVASDSTSTLDDNQKEILINGDTPIFLDGGSDGTFTDDEFEELVVDKMEDYADTDSEVHDLAINVESIFYDTGFSLDTKKELVNFITERKDTCIILSTHVASLGEKYYSLSDARAIGTALKSRYSLAPESDYFGTPVCRGVVVCGTGILRDGSTNDRIPLSYEIAIKAARMMGSSTGKWDTTYMFDCYPNNTVDELISVEPEFIPAGIKPTIWNEGLVWVQPYDRSTYFFPGIQTIYDDDTSVLNNFFVMMALCQMTKSGFRVWRRLTGTSGLTDEAFIAKAETIASEDLKDKFGGVVTVVPTITITDNDALRGYSWRMIWKLYGNNMKTVAVHSSEVYRMSDLEDSE